MISMDAKMAESRSVALRVLIATQIIFTILGFASAFMLLYSPSGKAIGLSLDLLDNTPIDDFTLVGLFFLAFYGVLPALAAYGLVTRKRWQWTDAINKWTDQHWSWTASLAVGIVILLWIALELALLGFLSGIGGVLQVAMAIIGLWIVALSMLPGVRHALKRES